MYIFVPVTHAAKTRLWKIFHSAMGPRRLGPRPPSSYADALICAIVKNAQAIRNVKSSFYWRTRVKTQNALLLSCSTIRTCPHCRRKVRLSPKTARKRRQATLSHFSATVWTGLKQYTTNQQQRDTVSALYCLLVHFHLCTVVFLLLFYVCDIFRFEWNESVDVMEQTYDCCPHTLRWVIYTVVHNMPPVLSTVYTAVRIYTARPLRHSFVREAGRQAPICFLLRLADADGNFLYSSINDTTKSNIQEKVGDTAVSSITKKSR